MNPISVPMHVHMHRGREGGRESERERERERERECETAPCPSSSTCSVWRARMLDLEDSDAEVAHPLDVMSCSLGAPKHWITKP